MDIARPHEPQRLRTSQDAADDAGEVVVAEGGEEAGMRNGLKELIPGHPKRGLVKPIGGCCVLGWAMYGLKMFAVLDLLTNFAPSTTTWSCSSLP